MVDLTVKQKLRNFYKFGARVGDHSNRSVAVFALLTFIGSFAGIFPPERVEAWYARGVFPKISHFFSIVSDSIPVSWLDVVVLLALILIGRAIWQRRFQPVLTAVLVAYLIFFWSWGLNYHRPPLASKLPFDASKAETANIERLTRRTADEINRLFREKAESRAVPGEAERRVARVVEIIDGSSWKAPSRVKASVLANPWFRVAGVDGLFNPFGHEPLVNTRLLDIERPFVIAHELGHVRGYPNEGDANMVALLATILSEDPAVQYSGWLHFWFYVRSREFDSLLDDGPRRDLERIFQRVRRDRVQWLSNFQTAILDAFLRANSVEEGVRSYSRIVVLAAGTEDHWEQFR